MISNEQLAEWERLANEATPGPWYAYVKTEASVAIIKDPDDDSDDGSHIRVTENRYYDAIASKKTFEDVCTCGNVEEKDIAFIAAAREAVPALIAEVRRLQSENDKYYNTMMQTNNKAAQFMLERDWLAMSNADRCWCNKRCPSPDKDCSDCWIDAAQEAVKNGWPN